MLTLQICVHFVKKKKGEKKEKKRRNTTSGQTLSKLRPLTYESADSLSSTIADADVHSLHRCPSFLTSDKRYSLANKWDDSKSQLLRISCTSTTRGRRVKWLCACVEA